MEREFSSRRRPRLRFRGKMVAGRDQAGRQARRHGPSPRGTSAAARIRGDRQREVAEETGIEAVSAESSATSATSTRGAASGSSRSSFYLLRYRRGRIDDPRPRSATRSTRAWLPLEDAPRLLAYKSEREMAEKALAASRRKPYDPATSVAEPMYALNFYSPIVADQLRTRRKTATIRLGDKSAKYKKGMIVQVLAGARYSPRDKIFDAVIDKVEVKTIAELTARDRARQPRDPEARGDAGLPQPALQPADRRRRDGDGDPRSGARPFACRRARAAGLRRTSHRRWADAPRSLQDGHAARLALARICAQADRLGPVPRRTDYLPGLRICVPRARRGRISSPHASHSTVNADVKRALQDGRRHRISPSHCRAGRGQVRPPTPRSRAGRSRSRGRRKPSPRGSSGVPPSAGCSRSLTSADITHRVGPIVRVSTPWRSPGKPSPSPCTIREAGLDRDDLFGSTATCCSHAGSRSAVTSSTNRGRSPAPSTRAAATRRPRRHRDCDGRRGRRHSAPP